jgi:hypothetical protein
VKCLNSNELELLKLWKKTSFGRSFFVADTQVNFFSYLAVEELFAECTNEPTFYQALLAKWQAFLTKIKLDFATLFKERGNKTKKESSPLLLEIENRC